MIYNPVNEVIQSKFFLLIFKKVPQKYGYRYRGTNFSQVPSTGTAVLLRSTVPTYAYQYDTLGIRLGGTRTQRVLYHIVKVNW